MRLRKSTVLSTAYLLSVSGVVAFKQGAQEQFQTVGLVNFAGARVVVDGGNAHIRIRFGQRANHALAGHVVRQATERLQANDVARTFMDKVQHIAGEEPAFAGLIA